MSTCAFRFATALSFALSAAIATPAAMAATASRGAVYVSQISGGLYFIPYAFDGTTLTLAAPRLVAQLSRGGGMQVLPDRRVAVVGAGIVSIFDPRTNTFVTGFTANNGNTVMYDPNVARLWAGWKDTALSEVPLAPFGNGTAHGITGSDGVATMIAITPSNGTFYTTGGEAENGSFGRIDLGTFVTTRLAPSVFATGIVYDGVTATLITAGLGRARQVAVSDPETELSTRDDSASQNYLQLTPTGDRHYLGTRSGGISGVVMLDASSSGLIGDPTSVLASAPTGSLNDLSGALGVDMDSVFYDGLDGPAQLAP